VEDGLETAPLVDREIPDDPAALDAIRREALASPIFKDNWIFEKNGHTGIILIYILADDREYLERRVDEQIVAIAHGEAAEGAQVWIAGQPHLKVAQYHTQRTELRRSLPLIGLVLLLVLLVSFRTVRGVALPLLTVAISLAWTFATAVLIGRPLNMITMLAPAVLAILGLSYAVHVVSEYYDELRHDPERPTPVLMYEGMRKIWLPVFLTGVTTSAGFLAMQATLIPAVREVGQLLLIGTAFSVFLSLFVLPAMVTVFGRPRRLPPGAKADGDWFGHFAAWIAGFVLEHRRAVLRTSLVVGVVLALFATRMEVVSDGIGSFAPHTAIRSDYEAINEHLGGALAFNVVLEASYVDAFKEPENLVELEKLQEWLESQDEIGNTGSIVDFVTIMHRAFNGDDPEFLRIPESRRLVATLLFFGASDDTERFLDARNQMVSIALRTTLRRSSEVKALTARIEQRLASLPAHLKPAQVTGNPILIQRMVDNIVWGQVISIGLALVLIFPILWRLFMSPRTGFIALLPNILPLLAFFGGLGMFGIPLSTATSLIPAMALGIAIDDTIHYFNRFQHDAKLFADERVATVRALRSVGRPMTYTTAALVLGFLVLTRGDLLNQVQFGAMAAFTLGFAWVVDFTLTPALCSGLRIVTLWDTLTLDLGEAPEKSIPLFRGLKSWDCGVVARMASLRTVPAGQPLWLAGDVGREMYVVIDGKVETYRETPEGGRDIVWTGERGETVGEVGMFHMARTLGVDVAEDARLLRLTQNNMGELARRYPRIASVLFGNLNSVMAEIVAREAGRARA
jgi:predicted RND superfamily exporter protein